MPPTPRFWYSHLESRAFSLYNWDTILGQERVGGDTGNRWDIKTEYNDDGVHYNEAGNAVIAAQVLSVLKSAYTKISTTYVSEYQSVYNSFTSNPTAGTAWIQNRFMNDLKTAGILSKHDTLQVYAAHINTAGESQKDWANVSRTITPVDSPTFTAKQGVAGNGTSSYVNTGWKPSDGVNFAQASNSFWIYCRTARAASSSKGHGVMGATYHTTIQQRTGGGNFLSYNNSATAASVTNGDSSGLFLSRRESAALVDLWRNGTEMAADKSAASNVRPDKEFYVGAYNNNGTATFFNVDQIAMFGAGAYLDNTEVAALTTAVERYMDAFETGVIS